MGNVIAALGLQYPDGPVTIEGGVADEDGTRQGGV